MPLAFHRLKMTLPNDIHVRHKASKECVKEFEQQSQQ